MVQQHDQQTVQVCQQQFASCASNLCHQKENESARLVARARDLMPGGCLVIDADSTAGDSASCDPQLWSSTAVASR